jgi:hypothetical protein
MTPDMPTPPAELGRLSSLWRITPQWQIYEIEGQEPRNLAWAFLPGPLRPDGMAIPAAGIPAKASDAYRALSTGMAGACTRRPGGTDAIRSGDGILWTVSPRPLATLDQMPPMEPLALLATARDAARELAAMHRRQVLHLDVHPEMIEMTESGASPIGCGIDIRSTASFRPDNRELARIGFAAPELWDTSRRALLGPWTDLYGLAATLFRTIVGEAPPDFRDRLADLRGASAAMADILRGRIDLPNGRGERLIAAIVDGLEPDIAKRGSDLEAWADRLTLDPGAAPRSEPPGYVSDEKDPGPIDRGGEPWPTYTPRWRRLTLSIIAAGLLVMAAAAAAIVWVRWGTEPVPTFELTNNEVVLENAAIETPVPQRKAKPTPAPTPTPKVANAPSVEGRWRHATDPRCEVARNVAVEGGTLVVRVEGMAPFRAEIIDRDRETGTVVGREGGKIYRYEPSRDGASLVMRSENGPSETWSKCN